VTGRGAGGATELEGAEDPRADALTGFGRECAVLAWSDAAEDPVGDVVAVAREEAGAEDPDAEASRSRARGEASGHVDAPDRSAGS
jgi:hypothetical protein